MPRINFTVLDQLSRKSSLIAFLTWKFTNISRFFKTSPKVFFILYSPTINLKLGFKLECSIPNGNTYQNKGSILIPNFETVKLQVYYNFIKQYVSIIQYFKIKCSMVQNNTGQQNRRFVCHRHCNNIKIIRSLTITDDQLKVNDKILSSNMLSDFLYHPQFLSDILVLTYQHKNRESSVFVTT